MEDTHEWARAGVMIRESMDDDARHAMMVITPNTTNVAQNFPNPFNPETTISYTVLVPTQIKLAIYNVMGQEIRTLVNAEKTSGKYQVVWNGRDDFGRQVASGIYLYRLVAGDFVDTRKMLILK